MADDAERVASELPHELRQTILWFPPNGEQALVAANKKRVMGAPPEPPMLALSRKGLVFQQFWPRVRGPRHWDKFASLTQKGQIVRAHLIHTEPR